MSPMLRGEALPLPRGEISGLRDELVRDYGDGVVATAGGPLLVVRVPHVDPDFLRDVEAAVEVMPYRDLKGFRGALLLGDRGHLGVSIEMVRSLLEGRERALFDWIARLRVQMEPWGFHVGYVPSDPRRRMRAAFRVDVDSVHQLDEPHFQRLAALLPSVKTSTPGQVRPTRAHLIAHEDQVDIDGAAFFTELETRRRRAIEKSERQRRLENEERHAMAVAQLERIGREKQTRMPPPPDLPGPSAARTPSSPPIAPPPRPARSLPPPPVDVPRGMATRPVPPPPVAPPAPRAAPPRSLPDLKPRAPTTRHPAVVAGLKAALEAAGYRVKESLTVKELPIALAGARPIGHPARVLIVDTGRLTQEEAHRIVLTGRTVGSDLVVVVADDKAPEADRVVLATNVKVIRPEDARDVRFG